MPEEVEEDSVPENSVCTILTENLNNLYIYDPESQTEMPLLEFLEECDEESGPDFKNRLISVEQLGHFPYNCCGRLCMEF